jgi:hypothetical protein
MTREKQMERYEELGLVERERGSDGWVLTKKGEDFCIYMINWLVKLYEWIPPKYRELLLKNEEPTGSA